MTQRTRFLFRSTRSNSPHKTRKMITLGPINAKKRAQSKTPKWQENCQIRQPLNLLSNPHKNLAKLGRPSPLKLLKVKTKLNYKTTGKKSSNKWKGTRFPSQVLCPKIEARLICGRLEKKTRQKDLIDSSIFLNTSAHLNPLEFQSEQIKPIDFLWGLANQS